MGSEHLTPQDPYKKGDRIRIIWDHVEYNRGNYLNGIIPIKNVRRRLPMGNNPTQVQILQAVYHKSLERHLLVNEILVNAPLKVRECGKSASSFIGIGLRKSKIERDIKIAGDAAVKKARTEI